MEHLKIAIADDNQKILDLLDRVIGMEKDMNLVGKAKNGEEMCQIIKDKQPDVVLLDLIMPKMDIHPWNLQLQSLQALQGMLRQFRAAFRDGMHVLTDGGEHIHDRC